MATTTIHLNERTPKLAPDELTKSPFAFQMFSDKFHYAMVTRCFGGHIPIRASSSGVRRHISACFMS